MAQTTHLEYFVVLQCGVERHDGKSFGSHPLYLILYIWSSDQVCYQLYCIEAKHKFFSSVHHMLCLDKQGLLNTLLFSLPPPCWSLWCSVPAWHRKLEPRPCSVLSKAHVPQKIWIMGQPSSLLTYWVGDSDWYSSVVGEPLAVYNHWVIVWHCPAIGLDKPDNRDQTYRAYN